MLYTKEFYDVKNAFEKYANDYVRAGSMGLKMESVESWKDESYYCDELANEAFKLFYAGYSFGKSVWRDL